MKTFKSKFTNGDKVRCQKHEGSPVYYVDCVSFHAHGGKEYKCCTFNNDGALTINYFYEYELELVENDKPIGFKSIA